MIRVLIGVVLSTIMCPSFAQMERSLSQLYIGFFGLSVAYLEAEILLFENVHPSLPYKLLHAKIVIRVMPNVGLLF